MSHTLSEQDKAKLLMLIGALLDMGEIVNYRDTELINKELVKILKPKQ